MDGSRVGRRGGAAAGRILSSSVEGTCPIILCIPRGQNGAGSQRTHWKPWAWFPVSVGWGGQRKRNKGDVDGCQQRRGALTSKGARGMEGVFCPRPATGTRLSVQTHPANVPGLTEPSGPADPRIHASWILKAQDTFHFPSSFYW